MKIQEAFRTFIRLRATVTNWPLYFLNRLGWTAGRVTYRLRNGLTLTSRAFSTDRGALNDVWLDESYDPNAFGYPFNWSDCRTMIDIGANIGAFTLFAASKAPQSRIVAIEAEPSNASIVEENVMSNHLQNRISVLPKALGNREGTMTLYLSPQNSGGNSMFGYQKESKAITVPMTTLQRVFEEYKIDTCDYLKIDCEGAEYDILYSLPTSITERIRFMAIEYHHFSKDPSHTPEKLQSFLQQRGFMVTKPKKSFFFAERR